MFAHLYKIISDDKWHFSQYNGYTSSNKILNVDSILEERKLGQGHKDCQKDPDKECLDFFELK